MMKALSISFRGAEINIRDRLAFTPEIRLRLRERIGGVVLCTCCRTELYFPGDIEAAISALSEFSGIDLARIVRIYEGEDALKHLFKVACGLESAIIGEDEILRQVKEAYSEAGDAGTELNTAFQAAIACAKRIKTETELSKVPVSAATIAANEAARFKDNVTVLMIGASGRIGSSTIRNLTAHKNVNVIRAVRIHDNTDNGRCIDYADRYDYINAADCIISATSNPHFTITAERLSQVLTDRKPRLFIDLAVPRDIEDTVGALDGVRLLNIDDINVIARRGSEQRLTAAGQAECIIAEETASLQKRLALSAFIPVLGRLGKEHPKFDRLIYHLRDELDPAQFSAILREMERLVG